MTDPIFDVAGRVVVITGACGLIGRKIAAELNTRGTNLVLADIENTNPSDLQNIS